MMRLVINCYLIALLSFVSFGVEAQTVNCDDSDNDGVCDNIDLDDDNDGILDADECPNTLVSKSFETSGGTTTTFLAPSADGGFRFDIFKLDNSFNLNVNGIDVVTNQIQCEGGGASGESLLVFSADNTGFGQGGNDNVWVINGDANEPVVRLIIGPNGEVSFQGKRNSGRGLESMEILSGDPQPVNVTWNTSGNNTVVLSQAVKGATNISGEGNGVVLCVTDTDGDGILNSFDSDSDGDGCTDAVEGSADFKLTDVNGDGLLVGVIDANGVPLVANGGQNVGSSVDENIKSNECDCDDSDNDGICDDIDLDDDNDGILDVNECMESDFHWSSQPAVSGKTATGTINGVGYTYTSSINIETTPSIFEYGTFPSTFDIPNTTVIKNRFASQNTIVFDTPIQNPTLLFSSIGGGNTVPINFAQPIEVLFESGPLNVISATQISGKEVDLIVRLNGTYESISFDYMADENYVNFTFGADFATFCDTDNDGTPDYLDTDSDNDGCLDAVEGDAGFKLTDVNGNDILAGAIDANGVPVAAAGGQGKGSSADATTEALVCTACDVEKPAINGIDGQAFHSFYFDADQPLNETVNGLAAGERYKVKVTGTWSLWSSDPTKNVIDAAYRYKQKNASADIVPIAGIYWQLNGASPSRPVPDGYNAEHTYFFEPIATGNGEVFFFSDNNYGDNGGGMNFEFYKILDTIRVCASNTNTLLTEYTDGQDLKWYSSETSNDAMTNVPNIDNNIAGLTEYWVTQTINGCESDRIQILYLVKPLPVVDLGADIDLCSGESVILNAGNHASYLWNTAVTSQEIEVTVTGDYSVEVTNSKGCSVNNSIKVSVNPCDVSLIKKDTLFICKGESVSIEGNNIKLGYWEGVETFDLINDSTIEASPIVTATYYVTNYIKKQDVLENGGFENNGGTGIRDINTLPGWSTTASDNKTEIWANGFLGHASYSGDFLAELNANEKSALYQDIATQPGAKLAWGFAHKARGSGTETVEFEVGPPEGPYEKIGVFKDDNNGWGYYEGVYEIPRGQNNTRFYFSSTDPGGSGNLMDGISFHVLEVEKLDSVVVVVYDEPNVKLGNDTAICDEETLIISAGDFQSYSWNTTAITSNIEVITTGNYSVEVTDAKGCKGNSSIDVKVMPCLINHIKADTIYVCKGDSIVIEANEIATEVWGGDEGFTLVNDSTIKVSPTVDSYYFIGDKGGKAIGENLIVNGDFENGNTGFTTEYQEKCTPTQGPGKFCINNNPKNVHGGFSACGDHTSGTGNMYIANGAPVAGQKVWCQTVATETNKEYEFSSWVASVVGRNPPNFEFRVNGVSIGALTANVGSCQWDQYAAIWESGSTTSVEICLTNENTVGAGNDFAVDDISFAPIHYTASGGDSVFVIVSENPVVNLGSDTAICEEETLKINAGNYASYLWNTTETTSNIEVAATKTYSVEVTDSKGCVGRDTVSVVIQQCQERLCGGDINFNTWTQAGLVTEGNWVVSGDGSSVNQTINGSPTFYNGKKDYLNVKFSGKMKTDFGNDDDFMGMVFGYQGDVLTANYPIAIKTYVFGWKQKKQVVSGNDWPEGFSLIEVNKTVNTRQEFYEAFTAPFIGSTVLATDYGPSKGYLTGIDYNVSIEYTSTKIKIYVDNNLIFDVDGCFDSGKIGFYNFSQPDVTYSDFNYQFISDIAVSDDTLCIGEEIELDLTCNQTNFYPDGTIYSWDLDDGTKSNLEEIDHTYQTPGVYDLELIVSDGIGCSDTATQKVYVSAYPIKQLGNDTTICADSSITLEAERKIGNSYLWSTNETTEQITVNNTGEYRVDVVNWAECITKDTINVTMQGLPIVNLGNDTTICADSIITFTAQTGVVWNWNNGDITPIITVNLTGEYSVIVADEIGCTSYDTIELVMQALPVIDLGNDTTICEDVTVTFDAEVGVFWGWNNGGNTRRTTVNSAGEYSVIVADEIGCTGYDTIQLATQNLPLVNLGNDTIICDGESVVLDSKNGGLNYSWNTGQTVQAITIKTTGVYGVEVTDDIGCLGSDSMELIVNPMPHVNLGNDTAICFGESVILNAQNPGFNYLWSTSDNQQSITVSQTSIVSVEVYDEIGCSDEDEISINIHQLPVVNLGNDTVLCKYQSLVLDAENVRLNFSWNTGDKSQTITVDEEGGYSVDVTDEIGCLGSDEIYITKEFLPDPYFEKDKIICEGTAITLGPDAGFESYEIYWLSNVASFEIEVTETGAYSSVIQSEFCKDTFVVNVAKIDTPDAVIIDLYGGGVYCFDLESTALRIGSEEPNISYDWIDFGRVEEVEIIAAGEYHVTASNDFCTSNYTQSIQEHCAGRLFIPNSFTPNNDGINDVFKPVSNGHVDDFDFRVYDRWGTLIFQTNNLDEGWDGRLRNNIVMIDVFVYKVSYQYLSENGGFEKEELVGTVTVLK